MVSVAIVRDELDAEQLRAEAGRTADTRKARRMLAIAMVLDGHSRLLSAKAAGMDRQTLRDWVHRYNIDGLAGLSDRAKSGRPPSLTEAQMTELEGWVQTGPEFEADDVVRWRCADLRDRIMDRFKVALHQRSVGKLLKKLDFSSMSVRPQHPQSDPEAQAAFKQNFADLARAAIPRECAGRAVEIWYQDEARVGQQGTLTRIWARLTKGSVERSSMERSDEGKRGTRPRIKRDRRFTWAYLFGAICPARGTGAAVVMPTVTIETMNLHLAEISQRVSAGAIALLILDGAGWHRSPKLVVPDNIVLLPLPPYAPELNPTENVWEYFRGNDFSHRMWNSYDAIVDACCNAWNALIAKPSLITSIGTREWAQVNL